MSNKPKFNPNQPYQPVAEKPKFDPSVPFEAVEDKQSFAPPVEQRGFIESLLPEDTVSALHDPKNKPAPQAEPEQGGQVNSLAERITDGDRWQAILTGKGKHAPQVAAGMPPLAIPGGAPIAAAGKYALEAAGRTPSVAANLPKVAKFMQGVESSALGRIASDSAQGTITGAMGAEDGQRLQGALQGLLWGGALGAGSQVVGKVAAPVADRLMANAAGIRKPQPGVGTNLIEQGVWGTKSGMQDQVGEMLNTKGAKLGSMVDSLQGAVDTMPLAEKLAKGAGRFADASGTTAPNMKGAEKAYGELSEYVASKGNMTPQELHQFKKMQGEAAYTAAQQPGNTYAADAARLASKESGNTLAEMFKAQNAGSTAYDDVNRELSALYKAKHGLSLGDRLTDNTNAMGLGAAGLVLAGAPGAALGLAAKSPLAKSIGAHAVHKTGKVATKLPRYLMTGTGEVIRDKE